MSAEELEGEARSMPPKVINVELARMIQENREENDQLRKLIKNLEGRLERGGPNGSEEVGEEEENPQGQEEEEVPTEHRYQFDALKSMERRTMDQKSNLAIFSGKMDVDGVMDWIESLNNFFECEDIADNQKVNIAKSKMQGEALTWWNFVQGERVKEARGMITSWKKMIAEIKGVYVPEDYEVQLHKRRKNLRQKEMDVYAYTEEFQKLSIKSKKIEDESERVARYLNGLSWNI